MDDTQARPNHHAHFPVASGFMGAFFGLVLLPGARRTARLAAELATLSDSDHVIDVGCGPGNAVRQAARRGVRVTGVDPSPAMLRIAGLLTRGSTQVSWVEGTAEDLSLPSASATVCWALATVHHWQDVDRGVAEAHRVLAPGGRLLAMERQSAEGAKGLASHGWTREQADAFAECCRAAGFIDIDVDEHHAGRRAVWVVTGTR